VTRCNRPGCEGTVSKTGFCLTCFKRPLPTGSVRRSQPPPSASSRRTRPGADDELLSLPVFEFPDPSSRILSNPEVPEKSRRCAKCGTEVGRSHAGQPGLSEGVCPKCRHPYSFLPSLAGGELVAGQYEVLGCFARGGIGWVYLARDKHLDDQRVVLKGMIDAGDSALAAAERRALTMLEHPNIVRILNFVTHPDPRTKKPREYIVMDYVDGLGLNDVAARSRDGENPLGERLRVGHVIACGLQILAAFEYLHDKNLVYCDMKPDNVILRPGHPSEWESRIKLIDMGAVRKVGERDNLIVTSGYQVPLSEITTRGVTVRSDLHALAVTLDQMFSAVSDQPEEIAVGLGSFRRALERASDKNPERRFASAAEMAQQLRGVQREIASLSDHIDRPAPSTSFAPTAGLLDAGLGTVPSLRQWTDSLLSGRTSPRQWVDDLSKGSRPPQADGMPTPAAVAMGLPVPQVDPDDPAAAFLAAAGAADPGRMLAKLSATQHDSPELHFARCRAHLERGALDDAADSARRVRGLLGDAATGDWRVRWHDGLLALARGDVTAAGEEFEAVYALLPGEYAPKLALGFCAEHRNESARAERYYEAVWWRDRSQVSAAFGLTRIKLSGGDRSGAVELLDGVPGMSRHYDNAAIAAVNILSGQWGSKQPSPADLREAAKRLPAVYLDSGAQDGEARDRLTATVREAAFAWFHRKSTDLPVGETSVFGEPPNEQTLRGQLERSYRALARQARDADSYGVLVDLANGIRPRTRV
jgi:serine/threonine-protein kinase PknG